MTVQSIPFNRILSPSALLNTYLNTYSAVESFYAFNPKDDRAWEQMTQLVDARAEYLPREALVTPLLEQNRRFGSDEKALQHINDLARSDTYTVMTGQQVGLFTGPLYTIYKAITTIKIARRLSHQLDRHIVPVFWMASDDHDFDEINHVHICNQANEIIRLELTPDMPIEQRSAAHIPYGSGITQLIDDLAGLLPESEFKQDVLQVLAENCTPDATLSEGFARLLARLFRGHGLIIIDPTDPALKPLMGAIFKKELQTPLATTHDVLNAAHHLENAGFHAQIDRSPDAMNLFMYQNQKRTSLTFENDRIRLRNSDLSFTKEELIALVETTPESFSHNVITRPIVQDAIFPALAYVGGPSEVAYYAQLIDVYNHFDLPFPIVYPRTSLTLVEKRVVRVLEKYDLSVEDFLLDDIHQIMGQRLRDEVPEETLQAFERARQAMDEHFNQLTGQVTSVEPTLQKVAESAKRKTDFELNKLEEKTLQAVKRAHKTMRQQIEKSAQQLYPRFQMQERVYNIWPYISLYGFSFMDSLFEAVDDTDLNHRVVTL